jgi:hypothetical protein
MNLNCVCQTLMSVLQTRQVAVSVHRALILLAATPAHVAWASQVMDSHAKVKHNYR